MSDPGSGGGVIRRAEGGWGITQKTGRTTRHALLDHVPEMVTISDRRGTIIYANPATERVSGFAPEEFVCLDPFSRMHPEDRPRCQEAFAELLGNPGLSLHLEHRVRHKDGSWRWVEVTFASLFEDPEVRGLLATVRDVTDRKRRELNVALLDEIGKDLSVLSAPDEIIRMVGTRLGEFLQASGCIFADVDEARNEATIHHGWNTADVPSLKRTFRLADYFGEEFARAGRAGETVVVHDTARDERANAEAYARLKLGGFVTVPFRRHGRWAANITVTTREPRDWQADEIELVQEIASRVFPRIERARAEEALSVSEEKHRTLFETMGQGYCELELLRDADGRAVDQRYLELNPAYERLIGIPVAYAKGRTAGEVMPELEPYWTEAFDRIARGGEPERIEYEVASLGRWFEVFAYPRGGDRLTVLYEDTTERKRAEEALRESERKYSAAFDSMDEGFCLMELVYDGDGQISDLVFRETNEAFERNTGLSEVVGRTVGELLPAFESYWIEAYTRVARTGEAERTENYVGDVGRWYSAFFSLVGEVGSRHVAVVFDDITERKRAEEALRESEERYRLAVEAADLGRWELVPETGEFRTSAACNRHLGLPEDARPNHEGHFRTIHPDDHAMIHERLRRAVEEGGEFEAEYRVIHPSGGVRRILSRARLLRYPGSEPDRLTGVTLDVTEARELEEERERSRARALSSRAEAAERERISRELHDRVAHTMAVAHQSLELYSALAQSAPERAREKLGLAKASTRTALDETRDLSAQLARRQTQETRDGLTSALRELLRTHLPEGVEADLSAGGDEKAVRPHVREQAYLVMREAVRNAVAHSGCERVAVSVEMDDEELRGRVEDDGGGFEPDEGSDEGEDGGPAGGVGLRSMRERTEMLGGRLEISSHPGGGTAVDVRIPLAY